MYEESNLNFNGVPTVFLAYHIHEDWLFGKYKLQSIVQFLIREYSMTYRGPGFLVVVWFDSSPILSPPPPVSKLSTGDTKEDW